MKIIFVKYPIHTTLIETLASVHLYVEDVYIHMKVKNNPKIFWRGLLNKLFVTKHKSP